ncbi:MAG TPA: hypothetical protein EYQ50_01845, partial [Verrucomicrobiales bacterium]|nr:hypothetical protein [Verrucomicrobiales bacterium]
MYFNFHAYSIAFKDCSKTNSQLFRSVFCFRFPGFWILLLTAMTSWSQPMEFDAVYESSPGKTSPLPNLSALYPTLQPLLSSEQKIRMNRFYQVPSFLWASQQLGNLIPNTITDAESAAQFYLKLFSPLYGLKSEDLTAAEVRMVHDTGRGGIIVKYRQAIEDIEVFRNEMSFLMDRQLNLKAISGHLAPLPESILNNPSAEFLIQEEQAAIDAIQDFTSVRISPRDFSRKTKNGRYTSLHLNNETKKTMSSPPSLPIRSKKVFYQMPNELIPAYYLELKTENQTIQSTSYYSYVINARTGQVLFRHNLENDAACDQHNQCDGIHSPENLQAPPDPDGHHYIYRVWADTGANPFPHYGPTGRNGMPHPTSDPNDGFIPDFIQPALIELAHGPISTQEPWLPVGAIETSGNNVDAYLDLNFPDGFSEGDFRPSITGRNSFTHQYNPDLDPYSNPSQQMAAGTMAFYTINFMHDWFYDNGFSEESGNGQIDNFGRGGFGGDPILVEIQDFEAINNASIFTPADGGSPTMRLHVFNAPLNSFEIGVFVETPNDLSGGFESNLADFGPQSFDINGEIRLLDDGTDPIADACEPIINADELKGNIALIDRGVCFFSDKTMAAQEAGAIGVIIVNNVEGIPPGMTGDAQGITIPVLSISINDGNRIKEALDQGETVITRMVRDDVVNRDAALDNAIVIHEWAHHMSQRLIADAVGLSNNQGASMSEGWSDFTALLIGVREADRNKEGNELFQAAYPPPGAYVLNNPYFGIRRYPFSTQLSINPSTFGMIEDSASLPILVPQNPTLVGMSNSEIHTAGFVWANMLWECYASLLNDSGRRFTEAQETMKDYLVASLKMTPPTPTFTEARDALLAVALAGNRRDFERFNEAFAKRGMGKDAQSPSRESIDHSGVIENFDSGVILVGNLSLTEADLVDSVSNCDNDGILDSGETGTLRIALTNDGIIPLTQTTGILFSRRNELSIADEGIITFPPSNVGETVYGEIQVSFVSDQS